MAIVKTVTNHPKHHILQVLWQSSLKISFLSKHYGTRYKIYK